jgi:hypothetical protein
MCVVGVHNWPFNKRTLVQIVKLKKGRWIAISGVFKLVDKMQEIVN